MGVAGTLSPVVCGLGGAVVDAVDLEVVPRPADRAHEALPLARQQQLREEPPRHPRPSVVDDERVARRVQEPPAGLRIRLLALAVGADDKLLPRRQRGVGLSLAVPGRLVEGVQVPDRLQPRFGGDHAVEDHEDVGAEIDELAGDRLHPRRRVRVARVAGGVVEERRGLVGDDAPLAEGPHPRLALGQAPELPPRLVLDGRLAAAPHRAEELVLPAAKLERLAAHGDRVVGHRLAGVLPHVDGLREAERVVVQRVDGSRVSREDAALADEEVEVVGVVAAPGAVDLAEAPAAEQRVGRALRPVRPHQRVAVLGEEPCRRQHLRLDRGELGVEPQQLAPHAAVAQRARAPAHRDLRDHLVHPPLPHAVAEARRDEHREAVAPELRGRHRLPVAAHGRHAHVHALGPLGPRAVVEEIPLGRVGREVALRDPVLPRRVGPGDGHGEPLGVEVLAVVAVAHGAAAAALRPQVVVGDAAHQVAGVALAEVGVEEGVVAVAPRGESEDDVGPPALGPDDRDDAVGLGLLLGGGHPRHDEIGGQRIGLDPRRPELRPSLLEVPLLARQVVEDAQQDGRSLPIGGELLRPRQLLRDARVLEPLAEARDVRLREQQAGVLLARQRAVGGHVHPADPHHLAGPRAPDRARKGDGEEDRASHLRPPSQGRYQ